MEYKTLEEAILDCLQRKKLLEAWLLGRAMEPSDQWSLLEIRAISLGRKNEIQILKNLRTSVYENLAAAYVLVSLDEITWISSQKPIENSIPIEVYKAMEEWSQEKSLKKRRAIGVRYDALLYLTRRSEQTPYVSSEPDIQENLEKTLLQSEYWSCILQSYMDNSKWKSDEHKESFYDTYFIGDIPDEWSLDEREKSHGRGLGKPLELARPKFIHSTIQRSKSLELWNSSPSTNCSMEWDTLYASVKDKVSLEFPMKPIKKVFEILHIDHQSCLSEHLPEVHSS